MIHDIENIEKNFTSFLKFLNEVGVSEKNASFLIIIIIYLFVESGMEFGYKFLFKVTRSKILFILIILRYFVRRGKALNFDPLKDFVKSFSPLYNVLL